MIVGIGHDISSIPRIEKLLEGTAGERFMLRVLTENERLEIAACSKSRQAEYTAGRFAAKEAVSKAFGCGIGAVLGFEDIEILRGSQGKPVCRLEAAAWERLGIKEIQAVIHLTITHDHGLASAFVVVEERG